MSRKAGEKARLAHECAVQSKSRPSPRHIWSANLAADTSARMASPVENADIFASSRHQQRRATDFSQADNDLRRFLAMREQKRRDSDQDIDSPSAECLYNAKDVFHTKVFGSVEKLNFFESSTSMTNEEEGGETGKTSTPVIVTTDASEARREREDSRLKQSPAFSFLSRETSARRAALIRQMRSRRFRVESCDSTADRDDGFEVSSTPVLENPEHQTMWYTKFFLGKFHRNFVGIYEKQSFALSILEERTFGKTQIRAILWSTQGPRRLALRVASNQSSLLASLEGNQADFGVTNDSLSAKNMLAHFGINENKIEKGPKEVIHPGLQRELLSLEKQEGSLCFKFGVILARGGQILDDELFANQEGSRHFDEFLKLLGDRIRLKDWERYAGGLDVKKDQTGSHAVYTNFEGHQIIFHVSTMLPHSDDDRQQIERKRHIGNDIVNIIFLEGTLEEMSRFKPVFIKSNFTHVYALICYQESTKCYYMTVFSEKSVPLFGPSLPNPAVFTDAEQFRTFLLVKLINGEKATYNTKAFSSRRQRTYELMLGDIYKQYSFLSSHSPVLDRSFAESILNKNNSNNNALSTVRLVYNSSSSSNLAHRTKEETLKDAFVKLGQTLKLDSILSGELPPCADRASCVPRVPWEAECVFADFTHEITCGDSWRGSHLIVGSVDGTFLIVNRQPAVLLFDKSVGIPRQICVVEAYGILLFRVERHLHHPLIGHDPSVTQNTEVYVFRLSDLDEFLEEDLDPQLVTPHFGFDPLNIPTWEPKSRGDLKENLLECSKSCCLLALSCPSTHKQHGLQVGLAVHRRIVVLQWRHQEEWIALTTDTADGFDVLHELNVVDLPILSLTLLPALNAVIVGSKFHFDLLKADESPRRLITLQHAADGAVSAIEIREDEDEAPEVFLTYNCSSHLQRLIGPSELGRSSIVSWTSVPKHVVCVFPYVLAATASDTIEFRSVVNGALLHTAIHPELVFMSAKEDVIFASTRPPPNSFLLENRGKKKRFNVMKTSRRTQRHIYRIPLLALAKGGSQQRRHSRLQRARPPLTNSRKLSSDSEEANATSSSLPKSNTTLICCTNNQRVSTLTSSFSTSLSLDVSAGLPNLRKRASSLGQGAKTGIASLRGRRD